MRMRKLGPMAALCKLAPEIGEGANPGPLFRNLLQSVGD
jgi:hypothetical protein